MVNYLEIKGSKLLIIFKKFLNSIGISLYKFSDEMITDLIKKNGLLLIEKVDKGEISLDPHSRLGMFYDRLRKKIISEISVETPEFSELSEDDLDEIMSRLK